MKGFLFLFCFSLSRGETITDVIKIEEVEDSDELTREEQEQSEELDYYEQYQAIMSRNKRTEPKKKRKEWDDEEIMLLIEAWKNEEVLYNIKHPFYYLKEAKSKAIVNIKRKLEAQNITVSIKTIIEKITNLRNYFGAQMRMVDASRKSGAGPGETYKSKWKFFRHLTFLRENLTHRTTKGYLAENALESHAATAESSRDLPIVVVTTSNKEIPRKDEVVIKDTQCAKETSHKCKRKRLDSPIHITTAPPKTIPVESRQNIQITNQSLSKNKDELYTDLIANMLHEIPECPEKDLLKLEIQHNIIQLKHKKSNTQYDLKLSENNVSQQTKNIYEKLSSYHPRSQTNQSPESNKVSSSVNSNCKTPDYQAADNDPTSISDSDSLQIVDQEKQ